MLCKPNKFIGAQRELWWSSTLVYHWNCREEISNNQDIFKLCPTPVHCTGAWEVVILLQHC